MVPIRSGNPLGAIGCYWADRHEATSTEVQQLQVLANMTAIAIENNNLMLALEGKAEQLERAFEGTLMSISRMIDLCDAYTSGHQLHVGMIASRIAQRMGFSNEHCQALNWVGLVHDVGKIAIPTEILSKPAILTQTELKLVQTHSEIGYELLQDVKMEYPIADIVRQHHERLDGSGYPQHLADDQILEDARILAVADVFEAMVSHRPYRPALGYEAALAELVQGSGIKYDAAVVDTIVHLVREEGFRIA
jgi:putative nucleotidyltransferase with HDIG domain